MDKKNIVYFNETSQQAHTIELRDMQIKAVSTRLGYLYALNNNSSIDIHPIMNPLPNEILLTEPTYSFSLSSFPHKNIFKLPIKEVQIMTLPEHGRLYLNDICIQSNQMISRHDIDQIRYIPPINFSQKRSFFQYKISVDGNIWSYFNGTMSFEKK